MSLAAGTLNRRVTIEALTPSRSASGEVVESWGTLATVWARVLPISGREFYAAAGDQMAHAETARFVVRWLAGVTPRDRLEYDGKTWNIRNIAELNMREGLEITAEAVAQ